MKAIPLHAARALLDKYVQAKDNNCPELIHEAFAQAASLTFSIDTDTISFPPKAEGAQAIATTLVSEFARTFDRCRTYYIGEPVPKDNTIVIPWLVLMRETAAHTLRAGKGFYRWSFVEEQDGEYHIASLHIHIDRMDSLADPEAAALTALQAPLPYPWLPAEVLKTGIEGCIAVQPSLAILQTLAKPAQSR